VSDRLAQALAELVEALRAELESATPAPRADAPDQLLSVPEAAAALGIGRTALYTEIQAGRCRSIKVGRRRLVPASAVRAYVEAQA
jgi:excisionase family DNA binding protein